MVVRAVIGTVVNRLPYSDHLPQFVQNAITEDTSSYELAELVSPLANLSELEGPLSPQQKIHNRILERRELAEAASSMPNDGFLLNHTDDHADDRNDALTESETIQGSSTPDTTRQSMVQKYLDEQNAKFDSLINKNLNVVLQQQSMYEDESSWQQLMIEMAMARDKDEISMKMTSLMSRASNWIQSHIPGSIASRPSSRANSRPVSGGNVTEADTNEPTDAVVRADDATIENFLDSLDYQTKVSLLRQLRIDLGISDLDDLSRFSKELSASHLGAPTLLIDKIETLMIIYVRLSFICLKFMIPMATLMYYKFKNNDVFFFNNKNFNRLLTFTIKFMESLEAKLKTETLNAYQYGQEIQNENPPTPIEGPQNRQLENVEAVSTIEKASNTPKPTWSESLTKMAINYWLKSRNEKADYAKDPRYAQYFSGNKDNSGVAEWDDRDELSAEQKEQLSFIEIAQQFADQLK